MFHVTILSEPISTVPEFVPEQNNLIKRTIKKNNNNCTKIQNGYCVHLQNNLLQNYPIFYLERLLDGLRTVFEQTQ
jgi:hypothetical protein